MEHYAEIVNNIVVRVLVAHADFISSLGGEWIKTSYNTRRGIHSGGGTPLRKNFAGIGCAYDRTLDAFISTKPYDSWLLNETEGCWYAPQDMPSDGKFYSWDETNLIWKERNV